jgi:hypothetical protein
VSATPRPNALPKHTHPALFAVASWLDGRCCDLLPSSRPADVSVLRQQREERGRAEWRPRCVRRDQVAVAQARLTEASTRRFR